MRHIQIDTQRANATTAVKLGMKEQVKQDEHAINTLWHIIQIG